MGATMKPKKSPGRAKRRGEPRRNTGVLSTVLAVCTLLVCLSIMSLPMMMSKLRAVDELGRGDEEVLLLQRSKKRITALRTSLPRLRRRNSMRSRRRACVRPKSAGRHTFDARWRSRPGGDRTSHFWFRARRRTKRAGTLSGTRSMPRRCGRSSTGQRNRSCRDPGTR